MNILDQLTDLLLPSEYKIKITKNVPEEWLLLKKGAYLFAAVPFSEIPEGDFGSKYVKTKIRSITKAFPIFAEKGLFLLYYGNESSWERISEKFRVDKTGLRPVILQSVHFLDPETGKNINTRTHWGPVKFGFCGGVIARIETAFK